MWNIPGERDERSVAVENRAGAVAYQVVGYLLILDMVLHTWRPGLTDWDFGLLDGDMPVDILVITLIGGVVQWAILLRERTVSLRRGALSGGLLVAAMALAALIALVLTRL